MEPIKCPRCGAFVTIEYVSTAGTHWTCPKCGRNSHSYTMLYDSRTRTLKEIPYDKKKIMPVRTKLDNSDGGIIITKNKRVL